MKVGFSDILKILLKFHRKQGDFPQQMAQATHREKEKKALIWSQSVESQTKTPKLPPHSSATLRYCWEELVRLLPQVGFAHVS